MDTALRIRNIDVAIQSEFAHVEDGSITYRGPLPSKWRGVSGLNVPELTPERLTQLKELGWLPIIFVDAILGLDEIVDGEDIDIGADDVTITETKRDMTAQEIDDRLTSAQSVKVSSINALRDQKKSLPILSEGYQVDPDQLSTGAMAVKLYARSKSPKNITTLTSAGGIATATFDKPHHLEGGVTITVSGWGQAEYNVTEEVTYIDKWRISYPISGTPTSPATGAGIIDINTYRWITSDNQIVFMSADEFKEVFQAAAEYDDECQLRGRELKDEVLAASTVAEINAIDIATGWPATGL